MKDILLVHLIRAQNGIEPFNRFLQSYRQNPGGIEHDFLVIFKGFDAVNSREEYLELLKPFRHTSFELPDRGFDITAYFAVARRYSNEYRYFCFLNSFSIIQANKWLSKLYQQATRPGVGVVGATGSWESHRTSRHVLVDHLKIAIQHFQLHRGMAVWKRLFLGAVGSYQVRNFLWRVKPFPNYHLRTNAFMISTEMMVKLKCNALESKLDAYRFESGEGGLTQQIMEMGKEVLVVGADGVGYERGRWDSSKTFRQSEQENLLVADNQTREYQLADAETRLKLSRLAWGKASCN